MFKNRLFEISTGIIVSSHGHKPVAWDDVREYGIMFPYSGVSEGISYWGGKDKVRQMEGMGVLNQILIEINIINDIYTTVYKLWARLSCLIPVNR